MQRTDLTSKDAKLIAEWLNVTNNPAVNKSRFFWDAEHVNGQWTVYIKLPDLFRKSTDTTPEIVQDAVSVSQYLQDKYPGSCERLGQRGLYINDTELLNQFKLAANSKMKLTETKPTMKAPAQSIVSGSQHQADEKKKGFAPLKPLASRSEAQTEEKKKAVSMGTKNLFTDAAKFEVGNISRDMFWEELVTASSAFKLGKTYDETLYQLPRSIQLLIDHCIKSTKFMESLLSNITDHLAQYRQARDSNYENSKQVANMLLQIINQNSTLKKNFKEIDPYMEQKLDGAIKTSEGDELLLTHRIFTEEIKSPARVESIELTADEEKLLNDNEKFLKSFGIYKKLEENSLSTAADTYIKICKKNKDRLQTDLGKLAKLIPIAKKSEKYKSTLERLDAAFKLLHPYKDKEINMANEINKFNEELDKRLGRGERFTNAIDKTAEVSQSAGVDSMRRKF